MGLSLHLACGRLIFRSVFINKESHQQIWQHKSTDQALSLDRTPINYVTLNTTTNSFQWPEGSSSHLFVPGKRLTRIQFSFNTRQLLCFGSYVKFGFSRVGCGWFSYRDAQLEIEQIKQTFSTSMFGWNKEVMETENNDLGCLYHEIINWTHEALAPYSTCWASWRWKVLNEWQKCHQGLNLMSFLTFIQWHN